MRVVTTLYGSWDVLIEEEALNAEGLVLERANVESCQRARHVRRVPEPPAYS